MIYYFLFLQNHSCIQTCILNIVNQVFVHQEDSISRRCGLVEVRLGLSRIIWYEIPSCLDYGRLTCKQPGRILMKCGKKNCGMQFQLLRICWREWKKVFILEWWCQWAYEWQKPWYAWEFMFSQQGSHVNSNCRFKFWSFFYFFPPKKNKKRNIF